MGKQKIEPLFTEISTLDLLEFCEGTEESKKKFIKELGRAFAEIGFVAIKNHGLDPQTQNSLYTQWQRFFSLPTDIKMKYHQEGLAGQRGYTGRGIEHAKGRKVGDLKEFFQIGQIKAEEDIILEDYPDNIWPDEGLGIKDISEKVYKIFEKTGLVLLEAIALHLGLDQNYFSEKVKNGNSILRAIHYFPLDPKSILPGAVRAAVHGDINLITLLMGASADGLEVLRRDGKWIPITALPDHIVVNVGDMLERLTNKKLSSTKHRVVNPPLDKLHLPRYSMPFFMHPRSEMDLSCLPNCIDEEHPKSFNDISAGQFLDQRLKEIGLK